MIIINSINIKKLNNNFDITLCKVNREVIGNIPIEWMDSISRSINDIDEVEFTIPSHIMDRLTFKRIKNPLYDMVKDERLICLNDEEYFVIKEDEYSFSTNQKTIKAYSLEYKLSKIDIKVEDVGFYLIGSEEDNDIYSLSDYMKQETGWSIGYVDDSIRYYTDSEGIQHETLRWQESVNKRWYDFLTQDIAEGFGCVCVFDTKNKLVNLYDVKTIGEEIQIYLSNDNYIKDLKRTYSSSDIVTRLFLEGSEEMDIIGATVTGYPYIENFSYFIENEEMSKELMNALDIYSKRVAEHNITWKELANEKATKSTTLRDKQYTLYGIYEEIRALNSMVKVYESKDDEENKAISIAKITELTDKKIILENEVKVLEDEIIALQSSINEINILCKKETATDYEGRLIFNEILLNELKEFVYCDTYSNDSFLNVEDLIEAGERELSLNCKPTENYTLGVVDFTKRIIDNRFRKHWNGTLSLGNIIILYDEELDKEVMLFFTGYTLRPNDNEGLELTISNKKIREDNTRTIADYLQDAKRSYQMVNSKMYLLNKQKYNRINLERGVDYGNIQ